MRSILEKKNLRKMYKESRITKRKVLKDYNCFLKDGNIKLTLQLTITRQLQFGTLNKMKRSVISKMNHYINQLKSFSRKDSPKRRVLS